jgi:hypothetical protein
MKNKKTFDSVKFMRKIRERLSKKFESMSFEEQKKYMRERLGTKPAQMRKGMRTGLE